MCNLNFRCLLALCVLLKFACATQPSYQVSIFMSLHPRAKPVHFCNGVILHSCVILTTASCLHYDALNGDGRLAMMDMSRVYVVAGQANVADDTAAFPVESVNIAANYNASTKENDLAVLRLATSLPLDMRDDMKWIVLDDNEHQNHACVANFYARNSLDDIPDALQERCIDILDRQQCTVPAKTRPTREIKDICAHYYLPLNFECEDYEHFARYNADRGTGLVCNSRLVALLSNMLPLQQNDGSTAINCSERIVPAVYVHLGPHLNWIYMIVMEEEYSQLHNIVSAPYSQLDSESKKKGSAGIASTKSGSTTDDTATTATEATTASTTTTTTTSTASTTTASTIADSGNSAASSRALYQLLLFLSIAGVYVSSSSST